MINLQIESKHAIFWQALTSWLKETGSGLSWGRSAATSEREADELEEGATSWKRCLP